MITLGKDSSVVFARNIKSANIHNQSRGVTAIWDRLDK